MKKLKIKRILCAVILSSWMLASCGSENTVSIPESSLSENFLIQSSQDKKILENKIDEILESYEYSGVVFVKHQEDMAFCSYGEYDKDSAFKIASDIKQFTAAAILLLQKENQLSLEDTLDKYYPDWEAVQKVKIKDLLSMRSGIKDYMGYTDMAGNHLALPYEKLEYSVSENAKPEENISGIFHWLRQTELNFEPQTKFEYSNSNYLILADIIDKVSGMTREEYIKKNILDPCNMWQTGFADNYDFSKESFAAPANELSSQEKSFVYLNAPGMSRGAGDMISSASDLSKWLTELTQPEKVLDEDIVNFITANYSQKEDIIQYGYGMMIGENYFYHAGNIPSYASLVLFSEDTQIIMLSNGIYGNIEKIAQEIFDSLIE